MEQLEQIYPVTTVLRKICLCYSAIILWINALYLIHVAYSGACKCCFLFFYIFLQSAGKIFDMHVCLHFSWNSTFCTFVSSSGRKNYMFVPSLILRGSTELYLLWSMWWERDWATVFSKQAHCVSVIQMFCCVTGKKKTQLTSALVMIFILVLSVQKQLLDARQWTSQVVSNDPCRVTMLTQLIYMLQFSYWEGFVWSPTKSMKREKLSNFLKHDSKFLSFSCYWPEQM